MEQAQLIQAAASIASGMAAAHYDKFSGLVPARIIEIAETAVNIAKAIEVAARSFPSMIFERPGRSQVLVFARRRRCRANPTCGIELCRQLVNRMRRNGIPRMEQPIPHAANRCVDGGWFIK